MPIRTDTDLPSRFGKWTGRRPGSSQLPRPCPGSALPRHQFLARPAQVCHLFFSGPWPKTAPPRATADYRLSPQTPSPGLWPLSQINLSRRQFLTGPAKVCHLYTFSDYRLECKPFLFSSHYYARHPVLGRSHLHCVSRRTFTITSSARCFELPLGNTGGDCFE